MDSSACFWSYPSTKKQSTLQIIEGEMRGKPTGVYVLFTLGLFLQSLIIFQSLYICHFISSGFLSRAFIERTRCFGDCGVVGGWANLLYRMIELND